jgi:hypothetical protein
LSFSSAFIGGYDFFTPHEGSVTDTRL